MAARKGKGVKIIDKRKEYDALIKRVEEAKKVSLEIGVLGEKAEVPHKDSTLTVAAIAEIHEYGLGVPERAFIRGWFDAYQAVAKLYIKTIWKSVIDGKRTKTQALELLGVRFVGEAQQYMTNAQFTPLSPVTIRRKGSSKPLIDTGQMRSAITFRINTDPT